MPMVSARIGAITLAIFALCAPPRAANAFGLNFGPLHLALPFPGYHRHGPSARTEPGVPESQSESRIGAPALLYPVLAWPSLDGDIFSPRSSVYWPFGYEDIFNQAFGKYPSGRAAANLCPYRDSTAETVMRITRATSPDAAQQPLLQKLATALGQANGYLIKSCPGEIPAQPVARLQLMENQIDATIMALTIVRPALQSFEQSLNDEQRARLDGAEAPIDDVAPACKLKAASPKELLSRLEVTVQPTEAQRPAFAKVEDAFNRAATDLNAGCPAQVAPTALGRLEATESRLDAAWRAVQTIETALADFQKGLSDEQSSRFNALQIASIR
jgi:LTXXQ motif family protein